MMAEAGTESQAEPKTAGPRAPQAGELGRHERAGRTSPASWKRLLDRLALVVWFGAVVGLADAATWPLKAHANRMPVVILPHAIWGATASTTALLAATALLCWPVTARMQRPKALRVTVGVLLGVGLFSLAAMPSATLEKIHPAARMVLTVGLAVATVRLIGRRMEGFVRLARWSAVPLVLLVAGLATTAAVRHTAKEHQAVAGLPPPRPQAPNVLLIVLDTVRAQSLSLHGYERPTSPHLDQFAKEGTVFSRAVAPCSWTIPTHASLFTGRWLREHRAGEFYGMNRKFPTLAEVLSGHGYATAGFSANTRVCNAVHGFARGFHHFEDSSPSVGETIRAASLFRWLSERVLVRRATGWYELLDRKPAGNVTNAFLHWLDGRPNAHRPFFAFMNYYDAHLPYIPPEEFRGQFGSVQGVGPYFLDYCFSVPESLRPPPTDQEVEPLRNAYDQTIAYLDSELGRLFDELRRRGLLDSTLVIVTSDHGEALGTHRLFGHGNALYPQTVLVPLMIRWPGAVPAGRTCQQPATLRDVPATVMDLLGLAGGHWPFVGESLARHWSQGQGPGPSSMALSELELIDFMLPWAPGVKGTMRSVFFDNFQYIRNGDGSEELYDLSSDPHAQHDLAAQQTSQAILQRARLALAQLASSP